MSTDDSSRIRARSAINAARRGHLPKPKSSLTQNLSTNSLDNENTFTNVRENSIEVYDDKFSRNSILTRSARIRKFKFYQYKPVHESPKKPETPEEAAPLPRDEIVQGRVPLVDEHLQELNELDDQITELDKKIADLNKEGNTNLNVMFELVNQKNDLLRRQMQLNILEQEKNLEKANEGLTKELRSLLSIDDSRKTKAELGRQQYLYDQLLALVDKRNELVLHMDVQEKCIEEDNALKADLKNVISSSSDRRRVLSQEQNCCIQ